MRRSCIPFEREEAKFFLRVVKSSEKWEQQANYLGMNGPIPLIGIRLCLWAHPWRNESVVTLALKELQTNLSIEQAKWWWNLFRLVFCQPVLVLKLVVLVLAEREQGPTFSLCFPQLVLSPGHPVLLDIVWTASCSWRISWRVQLNYVVQASSLVVSMIW